MPEINTDPLADLLKSQAEALGKTVAEETTTADDTVASDEVIVPEVNKVEPITFDDDDIEDDIYGDNDLANEIEEEDAIAEQQRIATAAENAENRAKTEVAKTTMAPDPYDKRYQNDAIGYQSEKLSTVSLMVQKVVAKHKLFSGGIPENPVPELGVLGRMAVMGELIDIYHKSGEKITKEFEDMVLSNWLMPDNTLAISHLSKDGTLNNDAVDTTSTETTNENVEKKEDAPTINITVEKNNPVTVNVDEEMIKRATLSKEINVHVKEVCEKDLLKTVIVENSNQEGIITKYDSGINDVPVTLPMSGYRCVLRPINYFDFIKLTAPTSQNAADTELKRWSVIYDHIKNPSIGDFENFEDFMKKTKYQDREILMWAVLVATADEEEGLDITCGNPKCRNHVKLKYDPRTIIHIDQDKIPEWYIPAYEAAPGEEAIKIWESANKRRKRYRLPNTGIIAEINEPSAYDFVTNKLPLLNEIFKRYRPDTVMSEQDMNDPSMAEFDYLSSNALFVSALTIIREENGKKKEYRYTNWDDIERIITESLDSEDSAILIKLIQQDRNNRNPVSFRVENVTCPKCGRHDEFIPINDIGNSLLFQLSRRLENTQVNLIEMD